MTGDGIIQFSSTNVRPITFGRKNSFQKYFKILGHAIVADILMRGYIYRDSDIAYLVNGKFQIKSNQGFHPFERILNFITKFHYRIQIFNLRAPCRSFAGNLTINLFCFHAHSVGIQRNILKLYQS